ncbi:peroxisomal multifunctional enzyme type 2-like isoform X1 [Diorhabda carinulata]|uniref:peroxisomal multifunctional enzyme type 2-like isoform X1 n=2 Tax=Diorhabda TaxID=217246 RepID=UPI0025A2D431|nr:peroxisomal multifunctional enzyme type 2-like isoform X1 [Diorhabda carinulata]
MAELRFDNRVAVVTGAGAGLGRAYALLFASRGAKVVVNDLGGGRHGDGSSSKAADAVVEEIKRNGGIAVADYNSVVDGEKIIQTALNNFGRVDILVNNAGILRDRSFMKISDQDWDLIHNVHLKGSFKTTQAAFPIFKKQKYGRIIMTASNSGLYGNFGQANYSAAKLGLVGLANTIAIEGNKSNIFCNVIVPTAASRLTEDILPPDLFAQLKPEFIAPVVAYLCHESCQENGSIIEAAAGWAGRCTIVRANGALLRSNIEDGVSIENVKTNWETIRDISNAKRLDSIQDATGALIASLEGLKSGNIESDNEDVFNFCNKDKILYALAVGASVETPNELKYLYEYHEQFSVLPTFFILPSIQVLFSSSIVKNAIPGKDIGLENVLHGEQYIEIVGDLPTEGKLLSKCKLAEVLDKGSGAAITVDIESYDSNGNLVCRNQCVSFVVGAGKFGGPRTGTKAVPCQPKPNRNPDATVSHKTTVDQAAIYRLTGDINPLHIDPEIAKIAGYDKPILHGLCSLGISVRLVLATFASHDSSLFKAVKARFLKPVMPGETLKVDMWREGNRIHFETTAVERNQVVIGGSYVDLKSVKTSLPSNLTTTTMSNLKSDAIFEFIIDQVKADPGKAKSVGGTFLYNITKDGKQVKHWTMDLKNAKVYEGKPEGKPNTTLTISDEDFMLLAEGKLNPQQAFMKGKLKITGNIMMAQKLAPLLKTNAKL